MACLLSPCASLSSAIARSPTAMTPRLASAILVTSRLCSAAVSSCSRPGNSSIAERCALWRSVARAAEALCWPNAARASTKMEESTKTKLRKIARRWTAGRREFNAAYSERTLQAKRRSMRRQPAGLGRRASFCFLDCHVAFGIMQNPRQVGCGAAVHCTGSKGLGPHSVIRQTMNAHECRCRELAAKLRQFLVGNHLKVYYGQLCAQAGNHLANFGGGMHRRKVRQFATCRCQHRLRQLLARIGKHYSYRGHNSTPRGKLQRPARELKTAEQRRYFSAATTGQMATFRLLRGARSD